MIRAEHLHKSFGTFYAVRGVSFEIPAGQVVGLLGPNGAGKTTTIRMITGYIPPTSGGVSIDGCDTIAQSVEARRRIGYLPEATPLYPEMRVRDYLDHRARLFGVAKSGRTRAIAAAAERCRLGEVMHRRIGHLSKGFKQRVGLAAALVHDPPVLVLDEPTSGLDPTQIRETRSLIRELAANRTVLVSSHILPEVEQTCDRVVIMARGRVRADGPPRRLVEEAAERQRGALRHVVEVHAPLASQQEQVRGALSGLEGAAATRLEIVDGEGWARFAVMPSAEEGDLREAILRSVVRLGMRAREVTREGRVLPTLEQVFVRLMEQEDRS